jgi:hypothetical protein
MSLDGVRLWFVMKMGLYKLDNFVTSSGAINFSRTAPWRLMLTSENSTPAVPDTDTNITF